MIFSNKGDFSEFKKSPQLIKKLEFSDPVKDIGILPEGKYKAIRYGYIFELEDGTKYRTKYGVRNSRQNAGKFKLYQVSPNEDEPKLIEVKKFTGFAEIGALMQGASYGARPKPGENVTRVEVDTEGFKIPKDTVNKMSKIQRSFASISSMDRSYVGGVQKPSITIKSDPTIIRTSPSGKPLGAPSNPDATLNQPNKVHTLTLDWQNGGPFHFGVEPWISAPVLTDIDDGMYIGNVKGDQFETPKNVISLSIKLPIDFPEKVIGLIRGKKIYFFKQSQLVGNMNSKVFSYLTKSETDGNYYPLNCFSEIKSDSEFREYAHNLMKNAHKDKYNESTTDRVVDGLLQFKNTGKGVTYGELIGRMRSGMKNKSFADPIPTPAPQTQPTPQGPQPQGQDIQAQPPVAPQQQPSGQDPTLNSESQESVPEESTQPEKPYSFNPESREWNPQDPSSTDMLTLANIIGTLALSTAYAHLYHWCESDYVKHKALEEYYNRMPYILDKLAEHYLANVDANVQFNNIIIPGTEALDYIDRLERLLSTYARLNKSAMDQYQSEFDEAYNLIQSIRYKFKRLSEGKRVFSSSFSEAGEAWSHGITNAVDDITETVLEFRHKFRKSPVRELEGADKNKTKIYIRKQLMSPKTSAELMKSIATAFGNALKYMPRFR